MFAFIITLALGVLQTYILNLVLKSALKGDFKKLAVFLIIKFALYAAVLVPVLLFMKNDLISAAIGFCVGLPGSVIIYTIYTLTHTKSTEKNEGDDVVEHSDDN